MNLIALKTLLKSLYPMTDLITEPKSDIIYQVLFNNFLPKMHSSKYSKGLNYETIAWIDKLALQTQVTIKKSDLDWTHGYYLYSTIMSYLQGLESKNITVFESGSAKGFSALVMAKAIKDMNKIPRIVTIDIIDGNKSRYWNAVGDKNGRKTRSQLLVNYEDLTKYIDFIQLRSSKLNSVNFNETYFDIAFLDGAHTFSNVRKEFNFIKSRLKNNGIVIFDDYDEFKYPGIVKFISTLDKSRIFIDYTDVTFKAFAVYKNLK